MNNNHVPACDTIFSNDKDPYLTFTPPLKKIMGSHSRPIHDSPIAQNLSEIFKTPSSFKTVGTSSRMDFDGSENDQHFGQSYLTPTLMKMPESKGREIQGTHLKFERLSENSKHTLVKQEKEIEKLQNLVKKNEDKPGFQNKQRSCNCKKSKCLKLYCDCLTAGELCGVDCSCYDCFNNKQHIQERNKVVEQIIDKNSEAFKGKIQKDVVKNVNGHLKGCNCRKSNCQKKYCECFAAGVQCQDLCKCDDCKNCDQNQLQFKQMHKLLPQVNLDFLESGLLVIPANKNLVDQIKQCYQQEKQF